jgi:tRNA(fMet)-specific endonuclease VapC
VIHLDANVAIALLNQRQKQVRVRFDAALSARTPMAMSMIVYHELMYGAAASERRALNENKIAVLISSGRLSLVPFDAADAREAADIRSHLRRTGSPIGPYDVLIAGQARRAGTTLVTANTREFDRVPGLLVVDWAAD